MSEPDEAARGQTSRRAFLKTLGVGGAAMALPSLASDARAESVAATSHERTPGKRPNILFVTADYHAGMDVPGMQHPFVDMPNLARLCREGAVCTRHHSTAPICMPARKTWTTGQYPHTHGVWENYGLWNDDSPCMMRLLKEQGYGTTAVGKLHLGFGPDDYGKSGLDRWISAEVKGNYGSADQKDDYAAFLAEHGLKRDDYLRLGVESEIPQVYDWPWDESLHIDAWVGDQARGVIERGELSDGEDPWFLWVSFTGPHNPWDPPREYSDPYNAMELPLGHTFPDELATKPRDHTRLKYNYTPALPRTWDRTPWLRDPILQQVRAHYLGNLSMIDKYLGRVLDALEARGALDDTIVVYSSDHGAHLGDHDLIHKGTHYDSSARVPFVVRYPGVVAPRYVDGFSAHVDLLPTLLSMIDAPVPDVLEGKDLSPMLRGEVGSVQDHVFIEIRGNVSIVTDEWKMGLYPHDRDGDLYELAADRFELHNVFSDPAYEDTRAGLTERILAFSPRWPPAWHVRG